MHEKRKHYRVALKELSPSPEKGFYVTQEDMKKYCVFTGILFAAFSALLLFGRKD